jgi:mRNA interferase MazF
MAWKRTTKPPAWYPLRGQVCLFSLDKERPAVILSTDALNRFSLDVCIVPISTVQHKQFSLRPRISAGDGGLGKDSWVKCDQVTTVEKALAVYPPLGLLRPESLERVEQAVRVALELPEKTG